MTASENYHLVKTTEKERKYASIDRHSPITFLSTLLLIRTELKVEEQVDSEVDFKIEFPNEKPLNFSFHQPTQLREMLERTEKETLIKKSMFKQKINKK